ncbi:hypothetical protein M406DRAFT_62666 [Cryphonectria parasitica EP155]|uniref:MFS maltose permease n=1 Tax=Cryphonectria parasitica (strain ATCC 38755 / EP155) TaxID=660469 RepID=A0A9P5CSF4_CRYP1|nr:uncharacterized protein M406DRAFT_62666 [Cryphonectria parasitica EP155]KAF3768527.1 hypothetical protein M406DRAFT_62666 [Cryphonectria parasitica EP155]
MRSRLVLDTSIRTFTHNTATPSFSAGRPQLPFLSIPSSRQRFQRQQWRYLTTERKAWIRREVGLAVKWTAYLWALAFCVLGAGYAIQQEFLERRFPTPHEWSFITRMLKRGAEAEKAKTNIVVADWVRIVQMLRDALARLEDPAGDGRGLTDLSGRPGTPPGSKDISAMPEAWRRGYYEALMLYCQASERVDGWVLDKTRGIAFPPDVVRGPSNPFPKPIPPGATSAPREEDCVPAGFPVPDEVYLKLIATEGLTTRQRIDAVLSYANWLEYKGAVGPAAVMYEDAVQMAAEEIHTPGAPPLLDTDTAVLSAKPARQPSANLLAALTALATFKARTGPAPDALPILTSLLQARRSLPATATTSPVPEGDTTFLDHRGPIQRTLDIFRPPAYPPPPPDGSAPPTRDSRELCEEAALHLHIGEIMYTLQASTREDGLAWTREGVDLAEEELHRVLSQGAATGDAAARKTCRECLASGLGNWATMVRRMASMEEEAARASGTKSTAGWFGLWSVSKASQEEQEGGRWAAEEKVVSERTRRAQDILEDLEKPRAGLMSGLVKA